MLESVAINKGKAICVKWVEYCHQWAAWNGEAIIVYFGLGITETTGQNQVIRHGVIYLEFNTVSGALIRVEGGDVKVASVVRDREQIAVNLAKYLGMLGLDRRKPRTKDLSEYLAEKNSAKGLLQVFPAQ